LYLLDTNVASELRRARPHGAVVAWLTGVANDQLYLSTVTIGEIQAGIEITRDQDAIRAQELSDWLEQVAQSYSILPMDAAAFRCWARLMHRQPSTLKEDAMIAATALIRSFVVVTRNLRDFAGFGVRTLDPFV
jgi:predicted nucleic acid-binding protein